MVKVMSRFGVSAVAAVLLLSLLGSVLFVNTRPADAQAGGGALLNEVMSDNETALFDVDGDASDWIELANPSGSTVNLGGAYLSDDATDLTKWQFPTGTTIGPNEYLVVFASDKDRRVAGQQLHTNFKISASGEEVLLVAPNGVTVSDSLNVPALDPDRSYGRTASCESITLEAEDGTVSGTFRVTNVGAASGGAVVDSADNGNEDYTNPAEFGDSVLGRVVFNFNVTSDGVFRGDAIVTSPGNSSNSFFVSLDDGPWQLWDTPNGTLLALSLIHI